MAVPRLNGVIGALEKGQVAITTFVSPPTADNAIAVSGAQYDGAIFEAEHNPYNIAELRDGLQYMLSRQQIVERGSIAPAVTPLIRVPCNGSEMNHWMAKQSLDIGAYGIVWPRVSTVEEAYNAVAACRISETKIGAGVRAGRREGGLPRLRRALLGAYTAGILSSRGCLAVESRGRDPGRHHV